jgi:hypothetical protein
VSGMLTVLLHIIFVRAAKKDSVTSELSNEQEKASCVSINTLEPSF